MQLMAGKIGNKTAQVNGYLTAFPEACWRWKYRPMLDDLVARIESRLEAEGLSASAASVKAGLSKDAIRNMKRAIEQNGRSGVSTRTINALAPILGTSPAWLLTGEGEEEQAAGTINVPLLQRVSAGMLKNVDGVRAADIERYIKVTDLPSGDWVALTVEGDSMNRVAPDGSIIVVNRADDTLIDNAFYIFSLEGGDATFKRFRRDPQPMMQPYSTNLDHLPTAIGDYELYVFGRVRRVITDI